MSLVLQSIAHIYFGLENYLKVAIQEYTGGWTVVLSRESAFDILLIIYKSSLLL